MLSYNKEQATGDDRHNIVTIVMREYGLNLPEAMDWVAKYHGKLQAKFIDDIAKLPSWGKEIDEQVAEYINCGLARWPRANYWWTFECGRYFGSKGLEYQKSRYVPLLPKTNLKKNRSSEKNDIVVPLIDALGA